MNPFDLHVLFWPASVIVVLTLIVTFYITANPFGAMLAALLKAGVFFVYFGWFFDGTFTFQDDFKYLAGGEFLLLNGVGIFNLTDNWEMIRTIGAGDHIFYYLYNTYAFKIFGLGYFAPVALNILLTVFFAYFGAQLAAHEFGLSRRNLVLFYFFLLFHPDVLVWSSIINGKDILVLLLHVLLLMSFSLYYRNRFLDAILIGVPVIFVLLFLRFYVPILFALAFAISLILPGGRVRFRFRLWLIGISVCLVGILLTWMGGEAFLDALLKVKAEFVNPIYGLARIFMTPIPFHTEPSYGFLNISALLHWIMAPLFILGLTRLARMGTLFSRLLIIYLVTFFALYAMYGHLQGPRHRVQLDFGIALLQFMGMMIFLRLGGSGRSQ